MIRRPVRALLALSVIAALPITGAEGTRTVGFGPAQTATAGAGIASPQDSSLAGHQSRLPGRTGQPRRC